MVSNEIKFKYLNKNFKIYKNILFLDKKNELNF